MKSILIILITVFFSTIAFAQKEEITFDQIQTVLLEKINDYRIKKRKSVLLLEEGLQKSAQNQCDYLIEIGKLSHNQPDKNLRTTKDRIKLFSSRSYFSFGENCLKTYGDLTNIHSKVIEEIAEDMFQLWRTSKPHNENLLNQIFTHAGFGFRTNPKTQEIYCVMDFGGN